jgi:hypothetical protein
MVAVAVRLVTAHAAVSKFRRRWLTGDNIAVVRTVCRVAATVRAICNLAFTRRSIETAVQLFS